MKRKTIVVCLIMLFAITGFAFAQSRGMGICPEQRCAMDKMMATNLDLSPEQTEKIKSLTESFQKNMAPLKNQKNRVKTELKLLWMQEKPDLDKIKAKQKEMHDLGWQVKEKKTDYRMSFRKILTPEQLTQFLAKTCDRPFGPSKKGPCCPGGRMGMKKGPGPGQ